MLDIELVRSDPEALRESFNKRNDKNLFSQLNELIKLDSDWRKLKQENDSLKHERNDISKKIKQAKKEKKNVVPLIKKARLIPKKIKQNDAMIQKLRKGIDYLLLVLPNVLHESVPVGESDKDNQEIRRVGKISGKKPKLVHHAQLALSLDLADFERAVKISGSGFYFLKNELALMDLALQRMAIDYLVKKGFAPLSVPFLLKRKPYEGVTSLEDFENMMYKVEDSEHYLIATSEHPMAAMYMNEILQEEDLPIKLAGVSTCFRKEIGKHGLDERGLFRVHQFNKIEQFVFCKPEDSWKLHEELLANSEWVMKQLDIPYRVVNVCSGDMGTVAAKKYDVEGYSPREDKFIELMSCSNCTDYQANALNIRYRKKSSMKKETVHTLNNTMIATARVLRLILEHYQTPEGTLKVPKSLQPHLNDKKEISPKQK